MYLFFGKKLLPLAVLFVNFGHPPARGHTGIMEGSLEPPVCLGIMCGGDCRSTTWNSVLCAVLLCVSMLGAVVADGMVVWCVGCGSSCCLAFLQVWGMMVHGKWSFKVWHSMLLCAAVLLVDAVLCCVLWCAMLLCGELWLVVFGWSCGM